MAEAASTKTTEDIIRDLVSASESLLKVVDALMPGIGHIAVQDYAIINDAPAEARRAIAAAKGQTGERAAPEQPERFSSDEHLLLAAMIRGVARWEFFSGSKHRGEICTGGMRYSSSLDNNGVPAVGPHVRRVLLSGLLREVGGTQTPACRGHQVDA